MSLREIVIGHYVDPDFGSLELIETRTEATINGQKAPLVLRQWTGTLVDMDVPVSISSSEDPPMVTDRVRDDFRSVTSNIDDFKRQIARSGLELAKHWVGAAALDVPLDESRFATMLEVAGSAIGPNRLTVRLKETANIFGGHFLEVRVETGTISGICLAG